MCMGEKIWNKENFPSVLEPRSRKVTQQFIDTIITEHRENRASAKEDEDDDEDLLDVLLRLQKEVDSQHPLTTENIKTVMLVSSFSLIPMNL
jgi:cytochrome P450